jgi:formylglycine-generating enzyme required for sulfatase activity
VILLAACAGAQPDVVELPGGEFDMGRDITSHADLRPRHRVRVDGFAIQRTLVTVADFRRFVDDTGYRTSAERLGYGRAAVLGMMDWEWRNVPGASWRAPFGEANLAAIPTRDDQPVTMVSWTDADAWCRWAEMRLPTEAQWEYAMRAGATTRYPWGDEPLRPDGTPGMNWWEGRDHEENPATDGFFYVAPVFAYPPNAWGIDNPVGNLWQWTADWWAEDTFQKDAAAGLAVNPVGPATGTRKVARGGSWWCSASTCNGYGLVVRGKTDPYAPFANNGFRCVR